MDFEAGDGIAQRKIVPMLVVGAVWAFAAGLLTGRDRRSPVCAVAEVVDKFSEAQVIDTIRH